jgi:5-methylcytosine-specific restriction endonuclease McrA
MWHTRAATSSVYRQRDQELAMTGNGFRSTSPRDQVYLLNRLLLAQGRGCFYCDRHISLRKFFSSLHYATVDHFIPLNLGGRDHISNVVLACKRCNRHKGSRFPTLLEVTRWNALAKVWPHIAPLDPEVHVLQKLCIACGAPISLDRLLLSMESKSETPVCSVECSADVRRKRRRIRGPDGPADS